MVDINISGVHYEVSDKIRGYISEKFSTLGKYHGGLNKLHVTIHPSEKHGYRVDVDLHLPHGKDVVVHDHEETVYAAIDVAHDKIASQLRKIHDKEVRGDRHASDRHKIRI
jgi:putative sigma-54 modulation protein